MDYDVIIAGGGLAGLIAALELGRKGKSVLVVEKKGYPFHRVCGEYVSNEVFDFLKDRGYLPEVSLPKVNQLLVTNTNRRSLRSKLPLGGFGISRYLFDHHLYQLGKETGIEFLEKTSVDNITFRRETNLFHVQLSTGKTLVTNVVLGAFGKTSRLDHALQRPFALQPTDFIGVKYHLRSEIPENEIALHNFPGGYCGLSKVENGVVNLCYLARRTDLKKAGGISALEQQHLWKNPFLSSLWKNSDFLFEQPVVINAFSFAKKELVVNHVPMIGDAAGLITPICGNGMAMAITAGAKIGALLLEEWPDNFEKRLQLETAYVSFWKHHFHLRVAAGRKLQRLMAFSWATSLAIGTLNALPSLRRKIISLTHGQPLNLPD